MEAKQRPTCLVREIVDGVGAKNPAVCRGEREGANE